MLENFRTQHITWDRANSRVYSPVTANSGDQNGRKLEVQILNGGVTEDLTGKNVSLAWRTPGGEPNGLDAFDEVDGTTGKFEIYYTTGMLSNVGKLLASIVIFETDGRIESNSFTINVERSNVDDDSIQSDNSFTTLTNALIEVQGIDGRFDEITAQLAHKVDKNATDLSINMFNEDDRNVLQGQEPGTINAVLGEGNVRPENTSFIYPSPENIYDVSTTTDGVRFGNSGEELDGGTIWSSSDYIKVYPGTYIVSYPEAEKPYAISRLPFYDATKTFASLLSNGSTFTDILTIEIEVPSDGYIRVSPHTSKKSELVVARAEDYDGFHTFKWTQDVVSNVRPNSVSNKELIDGSISTDKTSFIFAGKNLFNKDNAELNTFYQTAPQTQPLDGYFTLHTPILLKANTTHAINKVRQYYIYSVGGRLIDSENTGDNNYTLVYTPAEDVLLYMSGLMSNLDSTQVEAGAEPTAYQPYSHRFPTLRIPVSNIDGFEGEEPEPLTDVEVAKSGEAFTLKSEMTDGKSIIINTERYSSRDSNVFNFISTEIDGVTVHTNNDDVTPIRTFATVGANHGYTTIVIINGAHDKTTDDLGSQWSDGSEIYTLLKVEAEKLTFGNSYSVVDGAVTSSRKIPTVNLTHVSGATNTGDIDVSSTSTGQLYPSIGSLSVRYELDGQEVTADGAHQGGVLKVKERYRILNYGAIIDFAQNNIGVSYADHVDTIDGLTEMTNVYTFRKGLKCTTNHSLRALDNVKLGSCGFLQSMALNASGYDRMRYMFGVAVKDGIDFNKGVDLDVYNTNLVFSHDDSIDGALPPNHYVDWLSNADGRFAGFTMGYIPDKTDSSNDDRVANSPYTWDMRGSTKSYPIAISGVDLEQGDYMSFTGFRNYIVPEEVGEAILYTEVVDGDVVYSISDFSDVNKLAGNDSVPVGKDIKEVQAQGTKSNESADMNGLVINSMQADSTGIYKRNRRTKLCAN